MGRQLWNKVKIIAEINKRQPQPRKERLLCICAVLKADWTEGVCRICSYTVNACWFFGAKTEI